ncbi:hypothetical protein BDR06DRAFT_973632 [Suillus hirtellus]|nr:hypothetical protein BDR06DRAFT_973632 [Suillus hirtellus]
MDDILHKEIVVPDETQRKLLSLMFLVKLLAVLQALGILNIQLQMQIIVTQWNVPKQDAQDNRQVMVAIQHAIGEILDSHVTLHTVKICPRPLSNLVPGPDFDTYTPPPFHESDVAYLFWTISVVVWAYLRSNFVMTHFPSSYVSDLPDPHRVISLAHNYVAHDSSRVSEWHQIASIGEVKYASSSKLQVAAL